MDGHDGGTKGAAGGLRRSGSFDAVPKSEQFDQNGHFGQGEPSRGDGGFERRGQDVRVGRQEVIESDGGAMGREQAGTLGSKVLTYNLDDEIDEREVRRGIYSTENALNTERVREVVATENGWGQNALEGPDLETPGVESADQAAEWMAQDREDIENESGKNGRYVQQLMDRNRKRLTKETVAEMDKNINDKQNKPWELDKIMAQKRIEFLGSVYGRDFGGRN